MEEDNLIGKQVGNYRIIEEIAAGSFGMVYRAHHHILTERIVALKLLHMHLPARERERFIQEARFLASLGHRYILSVVDIGFDNGRPYLASTYASGGSLREMLNQQRVLPWDKANIILKQIGDALHHAHQQHIVHCDLKPENILFNAQGEAVLADFGIATVLSTMSVKVLANPEGTPSYMAPEQFQGQVSKETDQYALGCIAYEMVTGQRLFAAPNLVAMCIKHETAQPTPPRQINAQIPVHVEQAILKALAKQRNDRHKDVAAFLTALQTPPQSPQRTKEEWLARGKALYDLKRFEEALAACEQALHMDPDYAYAHSGKGLALYYLERYEEALVACERALNLDPNNAFAYSGKGAAQWGLKRYEEALVACEHALHLDPNNPHTYNYKGNSLYYLQRDEEALVAYEHALRLDPNYAVAYNNKGLTLSYLQRDEEALLAYEHALRLDPNYADAYNNKGNALSDLNRFEDALLAYEHALRLDPNDEVAYNNKANIVDRLGHTREA